MGENGQKIRFWTKKRCYDGIFNFFVVALGVWFAVYVNSKNDQIHRNEETRRKIFSMVRESNYNIDWGKKMRKIYTNDSSISFLVETPHFNAAEIVIRDDNLINVIQPHQISLIIKYVEEMRLTYNMQEVYREYTATYGYKHTMDIRKQIREETILNLAMCHLIQKEFEVFYKEIEIDKEEIKRLEEEIKITEEKILKGNAKFEK